MIFQRRNLGRIRKTKKKGKKKRGEKEREDEAATRKTIHDMEMNYGTFLRGGFEFLPGPHDRSKVFLSLRPAARPYSQNEREKGYQEEWKSQTPFDILNSLVWSSFAGEF